MWYRLSRIKSDLSGQRYANHSNSPHERIDIDSHFTFAYNYKDKKSLNLPENKKFNLERDYPQEWNTSTLTITAINKIKDEPAAEIKILFSQWYPNYAVVDDIKVFKKTGSDQLTQETLKPQEFSYAKHGLAQALYHKTKEWLLENKPEVQYLTGFISTKDAYRARIKSFGEPDFVESRDRRFPAEQIEQALEPAIIEPDEINFPMSTPQFEVRHKIKD